MDCAIHDEQNLIKKWLKGGKKSGSAPNHVEEVLKTFVGEQNHKAGCNKNLTRWCLWRKWATAGELQKLCFISRSCVFAASPFWNFSFFIFERQHLAPRRLPPHTHTHIHILQSCAKPSLLPNAVMDGFGCKIADASPGLRGWVVALAQWFYGRGRPAGRRLRLLVVRLSPLVALLRLLVVWLELEVEVGGVDRRPRRLGALRGFSKYQPGHTCVCFGVPRLQVLLTDSCVRPQCKCQTIWFFCSLSSTFDV